MNQSDFDAYLESMRPVVLSREMYYDLVAHAQVSDMDMADMRLGRAVRSMPVNYELRHTPIGFAYGFYERPIAGLLRVTDTPDEVMGLTPGVWTAEELAAAEARADAWKEQDAIT